MKFGPVPVAQAAGAVLAHSVHAGALRLKKGHLLTEAETAALGAAGMDEVAHMPLRGNARDMAADLAVLTEAASQLDHMICTVAPESASMKASRSCGYVGSSGT